jgi:hypothetical protein
VDFKKVKETVSIEQTAVLLGLQTNTCRKPTSCRVPRVQGRKSDRAIVTTPGKQLFYCFAGQKGGDAIELGCHVKGLSQKDAALLMSGEKTQGTVPVQNSSVPVPPNEKGATEAPRLSPAGT